MVQLDGWVAGQMERWSWHGALLVSMRSGCGDDGCGTYHVGAQVEEAGSGTLRVQCAGGPTHLVPVKHPPRLYGALGLNLLDTAPCACTMFHCAGTPPPRLPLPRPRTLSPFTTTLFPPSPSPSTPPTLLTTQRLPSHLLPLDDRLVLLEARLNLLDHALRLQACPPPPLPAAPA